MKFQSKFIYLHSRKSIWICRLVNGGHFVSASMCEDMDEYQNPQIKWKAITHPRPVINGGLTKPPLQIDHRIKITSHQELWSVITYPWTYMLNHDRKVNDLVLQISMNMVITIRYNAPDNLINYSICQLDSGIFLCNLISSRHERGWIWSSSERLCD